MKENSICLVMIVKNEAPRIQRCFSELKGYIDSYCIVDTGSSDNTIDIIKRELDGIPGNIYKRKWVNFGYNRTEAIKLAGNDYDYLLLTDADEVLVFDESFDKNTLIHDQYMIRHQGELDYSVPYLISGKIDWKYIGATHEYLYTNSIITSDTINSITIIDHGDGGSKEDKFTRDIELLLKDLEHDPHNARAMFYLANSYRDIGDNENAIKWYNERILMGGWKEEVTCAYQNKGECLRRMGKTNDAIITWLAGYEYNSKRAECIYYAIRELRINRNYKTAYLLAKEAKNIKYPENDVLFIERSVYEWKIDYEITVCAYYVDREIDITDVFDRLFNITSLNRDNILSNYKFYCKSLKRHEILDIDLKNVVVNTKGFNFSTPSIIKTNNGYLLNIRLVSYNLSKDTGIPIEYEDDSKAKVYTKNRFVVLDNNFNIVRSDIIIEKETDKLVNGIEDIRLINIGKNILFTGNIWNDYDNIKVVYGQYDINKRKISYTELESPYDREIEKNWVLCNDSKFIYEWDPITIGTINKNGNIDISVTNKSLYGFRGSSAGYEYKGELYFLCHIVSNEDVRHYYHSIVVLDANTLEYKRRSKLFTFEGNKIEYGLGIIIEDNRVILTHSNWDSSSNIKVYNKESLFNDIFKRDKDGI